MYRDLKNLGLMLAGIGLIAGTAGCYVPGGGWTLRSGVDWRTGHKPAVFMEMVDTKWDEWNRVSQMNMFGTTLPATTVVEPVPPILPATEPILAPASASSTPAKSGTPSDTSSLPTQRNTESQQRDSESQPSDKSSAPGIMPVEEVPAPPYPATEAVRLRRDRFRRSQNASYERRGTRPELQPAAANRRQPVQVPPQQEEELEDLGPVTFDTESVPQPPATPDRPRESQANEYRRLVAPSGTDARSPMRAAARPARRPSVQSNRPLPEDRLQGQRTPARNAWMFSRP